MKKLQTDLNFKQADHRYLWWTSFTAGELGVHGHEMMKSGDHVTSANQDLVKNKNNKKMELQENRPRD